MADMYDILLIQEHWLYAFELQELADLLPNHCWAARACDEADPIIPLQKPRGKGGVATIWKKELDPLIQQADDGSDRVQVIAVSNGEEHLCIINSYICQPTLVKQWNIPKHWTRCMKLL